MTIKNDPEVSVLQDEKNSGDELLNNVNVLNTNLTINLTMVNLVQFRSC